ncbi:hypothetical protein Hanom_Chr03g00218621 [Helianthus anomalus]
MHANIIIRKVYLLEDHSRKIQAQRLFHKVHSAREIKNNIRRIILSGKETRKYLVTMYSIPQKVEQN